MSQRALTTPAQQRANEKRREVELVQHAADWKALLSTEWGRRWLSKIIRQADPFAGGRSDLFDAGRRDFALGLCSQARRADPELALTMEREALDRDRASLAALKAESKPALLEEDGDDVVP